MSETNQQYHADNSFIGHSMKEEFRRSRQSFYHRYVAEDGPLREETDAMQLGTAIHCAAGEPEEFENRYCIAPKFDRRTKEGKADWADFQEENAGKIALTSDQHFTILQVVRALRESRLWAEVWDGGQHELTHRWKDRIPRKCRFDTLIDDYLVVDLKAVADPTPEAFSRAAATRGYYRQAAWYLAGLEDLTDQRDSSFVFLAVGTSFPYEVFAYEPAEEDLARAAEQNALLIDQLVKCYETGNWRTPGADEVTRLSLPNWAKYADQYSIGGSSEQ